MKTILFARYSIVQCLIMMPEIRNVKKIQFQPTIRSIDFQSPILKTVVQKLIRFINPNCILEEFSREIFIEEEWLANNVAMNLIANSVKKIDRLGPTFFLEKILSSGKVIKYFQGVQTYLLPPSLAFEEVRRRIVKNQNILCVPGWELTADMKSELGILRSILLINIYRLNHLILYFSFLLATLPIPLVYLLVRIRRGFRFSYLDNKEYVLCMPVNLGFQSEGKHILNGVLKQMDDSYLYGKGLLPGNILHVFGKWQFSNSNKEKFQSEMNSSGYSYTDNNLYKLTPKIFLIILKTQIKVLLFSFIAVFGFRFNRESVIMTKSLIKALYGFFEKNLELTNVKYKVELVKNDYNPRHVIDSIVLEKYGVKSIGIQHAGTPYDCPQLNFVEFDVYSIWGDYYANFFKEGWKDLRLAKTGREIIDSMVIMNSNNEKIESINNKLDLKYGKTKFRIIFLFSGPNYLTRESMWKELYKGFKEVSKLNFEFQIICRLREDSHKSHPFIKETMDFAISNSCFITEQLEFTTQELMLIADLIITPNSSFAINEALVINKDVYTFDLTGNAKLLFANYGAGLVIDSADNLIDVIKGLENNFQGLTYNKNVLSNDLNYHSDGMNCNRIRDEILSLSIQKL